MQFIPKHEQTSTISKFKWSSRFCVNFEDHRPEQADFAVVYNSPSIRAGPNIALFRKLEGGELSDKVLSWRAAIKGVTWQLLSKFFCSLSVCIHVTWWSWNDISHLKTLVSYCFVRMSWPTDCLPWQKLTQKFAILTCTYRLIVAS